MSETTLLNTIKTEINSINSYLNSIQDDEESRLIAKGFSQEAAQDRAHALLDDCGEELQRLRSLEIELARLEGRRPPL